MPSDCFSFFLIWLAGAVIVEDKYILSQLFFLFFLFKLFLFR